MNEQPTIAIPRDVIEPIIQARVTAAVTEALGGYGRLVETAIAQVINMQVDASGNHSNYSTNVTWLTWAMRDCVKKAASEAIQSYFKEHAEHAEIIKKQIATELSKKNSPLVKQLINALIATTVNEDTIRYKVNVNVERAVE